MESNDNSLQYQEALSEEFIQLIRTLTHRIQSDDYKVADLNLAYTTYKDGSAYTNASHAFDEAWSNLRDALRQAYTDITQDTEAPAGKLAVCHKFWRDDVLLGKVQKAPIDTSDIDSILGLSDDPLNGFDDNREMLIFH